MGGETGPSWVLVVDDDPLVRGTCRRLLEGLGLSVSEASNASAAVAALAGAGPEPLVLLDASLKGDGGGLLGLLRAERPEARVVVMSGHDLEVLRARPELAGASEFLQKPFRLQELRAALERAASGTPTR